MEYNKQQNYISLMEASRLCEYSQEYLSLRARQGKLKAVKMGRNWFTTKEWLDEYVNVNKNIISDKDKENQSLIRKIPAESAPVRGELQKYGFLRKFDQDEIGKLTAFWRKKKQGGNLADKNAFQSQEESEKGVYSPQKTFFGVMADIFAAVGQKISGINKESGIWLYIYSVFNKDITASFSGFFGLSGKLRTLKNRAIPAFVSWRLKVSGFWKHQFAFPAREYVFAAPPESNFRKVLALVLLNILAIGGVAMAGFGDLTFARAQRTFENILSGVGETAVAVIEGNLEIRMPEAPEISFAKQQQAGEGAVKRIIESISGVALVGRNIGNEARQELYSAGGEIAWQGKYAANKALGALSDTPKLLSDMLNKGLKGVSDMKGGIITLPTRLEGGADRAGKAAVEAGYGIAIKLSRTAGQIGGRVQSEFYYIFYGVRYFADTSLDKIGNLPEKIPFVWPGFKAFVYKLVDAEQEFGQMAKNQLEKAADLGNRENWANKTFAFVREETFFAAKGLVGAKNNFIVNFKTGVTTITGAYGNSGVNISAGWREIERKNEELKNGFDWVVYAIFDRAPKSFANGIREVGTKVANYDYGSRTTDYGMWIMICRQGKSV